MRKLSVLATLVALPFFALSQKVFITDNHRIANHVISFVDNEKEADWVWTLTDDIHTASFDLETNQGKVYFTGLMRSADIRVFVTSQKLHAHKLVYIKPNALASLN